MPDLNAVLKEWSPERLMLFLKLRGIEIPKAATVDKLIELVLQSSEIPIVEVQVSRPLLRSLTHEQLILYLQGRGYVIINKGKINTRVEADYAPFQESELLKGALKDYEEYYPVQSEDMEFQLRKVLSARYDLPRDGVDPLETPRSTSYTGTNIEMLLDKFGISHRFHSESDKLQLARDSINFFGTGRPYFRV